MTNKETELKTFTMKIPKDMWRFLKIQAADKDTSMMGIFIQCVELYRRKIEKKKES